MIVSPKVKITTQTMLKNLKTHPTESNQKDQGQELPQRKAKVNQRENPRKSQRRKRVLKRNKTASIIKADRTFTQTG